MHSPETLPAVTNTAVLPSAVGELIPFGHHDAWLALSDTERSRVKELLAALTTVRDAPRGRTKALRALAQANMGRDGWSFANLRTHFYALENSSWDWRAIARHYSNETSLPAEFIAHLRTGALKEHRSRKQAIEKIRALWREGKPLPGYGTWRDWFAQQWPDRDVPRTFAGDYPTGWSQANLYLHLPPRVQIALATRGYAAHGQMPHVIRDTSTLRPLEMIVFDDFECDVLAIYGGKVVRVRGVLAMDVATRRVLAVGFKPVLTDDDGKKNSITRADVQFLIKQIFSRYGVPADYPVTLLVENAAAAISEGLEAALEMFFHGQVRVQRTNMLEQRTLANGFLERGGKPWEKGWIESAFNLMHNLAGSLVGQKGSRYDNAPATTAARVLYAEQLLDPKLQLTPEQIDQLSMPIESFDDLVAAYMAIFDLMDRRTSHKMLGFDAVREWTRGPGDPLHPMIEFGRLSTDEKLAVSIERRMESPLERWEKLAAREKPAAKVPEFVIALLAFTPRKVEVLNRKVCFVQGGDKYTYLDVDGCLKPTHERTKLLGYFDETAPGRLFLTDLKGRGVGILRHNAPANIKDPEAIGAAAALVREFFHKQIQNPVREALADVEAQLATDRAHNTAKLAEFRAGSGAAEIKPTLSRTLADDTFAATPAQYAAAAETAHGLGSAVDAQAADDDRARATKREEKRAADLVAKYASEESNQSYL